MRSEISYLRKQQATKVDVNVELSLLSSHQRGAIFWLKVFLTKKRDSLCVENDRARPLYTERAQALLNKRELAVPRETLWRETKKSRVSKYFYFLTAHSLRKKEKKKHCNNFFLSILISN